MQDNLRYLLEPHTNVEFGEARARTRLGNFLGSNLASALIRLPFDVALWALLLYLGHRFGRIFFG